MSYRKHLSPAERFGSVKPVENDSQPVSSSNGSGRIYVPPGFTRDEYEQRVRNPEPPPRERYHNSRPDNERVHFQLPRNEVRYVPSREDRRREELREQHIQDLELENANLKKQLADVNKKLEYYSTDASYTALEAKLAQAKKDVYEAKKPLTAKIRELEEDLRKSQREAYDLDEKLRKQVADNKRLTDGIHTVNEDRRALRETNQQLQDQITALQGQSSGQTTVGDGLSITRDKLAIAVQTMNWLKSSGKAEKKQFKKDTDYSLDEIEAMLK